MIFCIEEMRLEQVAEKAWECFESLSTNGKLSMKSNPPFVLSPVEDTDRFFSARR
jgi:hypothetical protein